MAKSKKKKITIKQGGLGTAIESFTEKTGLDKLAPKDCNCKERVAFLNEKFPSRFKAREFTEEEKQAYKEFTERRTLKLEYPDVIFLCNLYAAVFSRQKWIPDCFNCSGTVRTMLNIIERLDKVYEACEKID